MSVYRSILPRRTRPVDTADFESVFAGSVQNVDGAKSAERISDLTLAKWNRNIPVAPQAIDDVFTRNFKDDISLRISTLSDSVGLLLKSKEEDLFDGELQHIFGKTPYARKTETHFLVNPDHRGNGNGKSWMRTRVELCVAFDESAFHFCAGLENGGYSWAKMGAHLDMGAPHAGKRAHVSQQMLSILEGIKPHISQRDYEVAQLHCGLSCQDDLVKISEIDTPVAKDVLDDLNGPLSDVLQGMIGSFSETPLRGERPIASAGDVKKTVINAFKAASAQKSELTVGRCLLNGRHWNGVVNFSDTMQMRMVERSLGGWRTITASC